LIKNNFDQNQTLILTTENLCSLENSVKIKEDKLNDNDISIKILNDKNNDIKKELEKEKHIRVE
jgi:hypothetical protein